jgi:hypothetical protein
MTFWFLAVTVTVVFLAVAEAAFRVGRGKPVWEDERMRSQVTTVQASTLGLLALILGFTLSMAEERFAKRREILFAEAGAIETTYLLAGTLPEPTRSQTRELIRRYVPVRIEYGAATQDEAAAATARSLQIQKELMAVATAFAREHPDWDLTASYLESLIQMFKLELGRDLALAARVPPTIHVLLILIAVLAIGVSGFAAGMVTGRSWMTLYLVPLLLALAYMVIADLDRSRAGFISTGDRPMQRIEAMLIEAQR